MNDFDKSMVNLLDVTPTESTDKISKSTDIVPVKKQLPSTEQLNLEDDLTDAYNQSKDNLQDIIDQGKEAMDEILQIAKAGQHPRAFEVFGGILKNVVEANKELIAMQKQMRDMDKKNETSQTNIDKAIFVGSTAELSKFIQGK